MDLIMGSDLLITMATIRMSLFIQHLELLILLWSD
jgi:hypothetical protein